MIDVLCTVEGNKGSNNIEVFSKRDIDKRVVCLRVDGKDILIWGQDNINAVNKCIYR